MRPTKVMGRKGGKRREAAACDLPMVEELFWVSAEEGEEEESVAGGMAAMDF